MRDLGGRALRGGGHTAFGRVYRSGAPEHLTDAGWAAARAAGVRTVVDLRNAPAETQRTADHPVVAAEALRGLVFVPAPTEDPADAEFLRVCGPYLDHPRSWSDNVRLAPGRVAAALLAVVRADGVVLVHCAGGRDRTGMISAMLLHLAGATEEAIIEDYAAGWRGAGAYSGHGWVYDPDRESWLRQRRGPVDAEQLEREVAARVPALREWVATFDSSALLDSALLDPDDIRAVRALLVP
ncbi:hypothetical protein GCM10010172_42120 [Paractinoplanes ferrugineus]|uniref:Protein-tyrosine-phosphatase n=1 Tax=Paractinoplanes ferrugineus TaxID=113564 RepID=A0A919J4T9_9ACTN|nr:protein-tyrosine-phosphatase [Actinoplanes ferrugineus]